MDLLKAEIARKRKLAESMKVEREDGSSSAYIRQRDQQQFKQQKLDEEQAKLEADRESRKKPRVEVEPERVIASSQVSSKPAKAPTSQKPLSNLQLEVIKDRNREQYKHFYSMAAGDVKSRLRALNQAATLFGEDNEARIERLLHATVVEAERSGSDADALLASAVPAAHIAQEPSSTSSTSSLKNTEVTADDEDDDADDGEEERGHRFKGYDHTIHFSAMAHLASEQVVHKFFKCLLKQWELDLQGRSEQEKRAAKGKLETRAQKQCKDYIRPLFKMCKQKTVPFDIITKLALMVKYCEEGNFRAANDEYIKTAIGNSAWPIGLTMVGIHERSGRERISTSKVAHIMNNELERKYLTSVKRLMTFAQNKRPDVAPSMKCLA